MKVSEIVTALDAEVLCGEEKLQMEIRYGFASDLMSDVLTLSTNDVSLITGLSNLQVVRTAEMSDIPVVIFVRNKEIGKDIIDLGRELGIVLLKTTFSMFKSSSLLNKAGLEPVY